MNCVHFTACCSIQGSIIGESCLVDFIAETLGTKTFGALREFKMS